MATGSILDQLKPKWADGWMWKTGSTHLFGALFSKGESFFLGKAAFLLLYMALGAPF